MIRDLQIMKDISPLFEKKLIIWGMGKKGCELIDDILSMGAGQKGIWLCDSNRSLQGKEIFDISILSPEDLHDKMRSVDLTDTAVLLAVTSLKAQDEILDIIKEWYGDRIDIYTIYAIEWGICLCLNNPCVKRAFKEKKIIERKQKRLMGSQMSLRVREINLKYFARLPLYNDQIILVYQPGKVGSMSINKSIQNYGGYALHCHVLDDVGELDDDLWKILNIKSGKIISLVRDPIARQIAAMWQNIHQMQWYNLEADFAEIEQYWFSDQFEQKEFQWFDSQMKRYFKIDVFEYPFDQEKGYSIIKEGNIELLLMKLEKLDELEDVIGSFLNIKQFRLCNDNIGIEKPYRFAYREFKENFVISKKRLEDIYIRNDYMKHFYSEQECNELYSRWSKHSRDMRQ